MNLTLNLLIRQVRLLKISQIKTIIDRKRMRFSWNEIEFYLQSLVEQSQRIIHFKEIWKNSCKALSYKLSYENFMENIALFSPLFEYLFSLINQVLGVTPSTELNIVDSTLIETKKSESIRKKDYEQNRVTYRNKKVICGEKGLAFINKKGEITYAELVNINFSDFNFLKRPKFYMAKGLMQGILLGDRGFNCKMVRDRILEANRQCVGVPNTQWISPPHKKSKEILSPEEWKIYNKRWSIETLFQKLKEEFGPYKLSLKGKFRPQIKQARFFICLIQYNLSLFI